MKNEIRVRLSRNRVAHLRRWLLLADDAPLNLTDAVQLYAQGGGWYLFICLADGETKLLNDAVFKIQQFARFLDHQITEELKTVVNMRFPEIVRQVRNSEVVASFVRDLGHKAKTPHINRDTPKPASAASLQRLADAVNWRYGHL